MKKLKINKKIKNFNNKVKNKIDNEIKNKGKKEFILSIIFGILIFQVVMMNMTIDIINYMRIKEGKEDLRGKKYKIGIICVFILLFGFGYLIVCSRASFWLLVFMDTVVVGIFTCIIGRINFIHIIMAMFIYSLFFRR